MQLIRRDMIEIMFLIGGFIAIIAHCLWQTYRSTVMLNQWARANGYAIVRSKRRNLFIGPFGWGTSRSQVVFSVSVQDHEGHMRTGWVRCGVFWSGINSNKVVAKWDDDWLQRQFD
jgi:hypothetical protein